MSQPLTIALAAALAFGAAAAEAAPLRDLATLPLAEAQQDLSKGGPELKLIVSPAGGVTGLFGGRGVSYVTDDFYVGGAGYGGLATASGAIAGGLGYGGFVAGHERRLADLWRVDLAVLVGGGGGAVAGGAGGSVALEPMVSASRVFGPARATLGLGYLYLPTFPAASGATLGLRVDFKALTLTLPIAD